MKQLEPGRRHQLIALAQKAFDKGAKPERVDASRVLAAWIDTPFAMGAGEAEIDVVRVEGVAVPMTLLRRDEPQKILGHRFFHAPK